MSDTSNAIDMRRRHEERMKEAKVALGGKCISCGALENLEFDHVDPATKLSDLSKLSKARTEVFWAEAAKCQLLCSPCHLAKTSLQRQPWRHGTVHGYVNRGCRCELCTQANTEYRQKFNLVRRLARGGSLYPRGKKPHGTYAKYKSGCHCEQCKKANREYMVELKSRSRS